MSKVRDFAEIISTGVTATDVSGLDAAIEHIAPSHIKTTLLYPAISGNISNGTAHSGTYGDTVQTDGYIYYYTDIKGSKPIKDPRIGAHFGSQRHTFRSLQLLEQETATHGQNVFTIDGREWCRITGADTIASNDEAGNYVYIPTAKVGTLEITGYFNDFNMISMVNTGRMNDIDVKINGANETNNTEIGGQASILTPLYGSAGRYVSVGSVINIGSTISGHLGTSPNINTLTITPKNTSGESWPMHGIELIAQDTTDTASKSKIQIPAQTVVSFNKQHSVSATAQHYDPFNGFTTGDLAAIQALGIDDTTSLGLSAWWYSNSNVYYRPYNGGRVVKWIDSSGTIKTSVNMMPFNATSANGTNINKKENASATNNDNTPSFIAGAVDHSQAEVAKTYNFREFGNGSANWNSSYTDATRLDGSNWAFGYVMDDGLTGLSSGTASCDTTGWHHTDISFWDTNGVGWLTFIGTGISTNDQTSNGTWASGTIAQNLPYGTHVVKFVRDGSTNGDHSVDGVACATDYIPGSYGGFADVTFHQPKMPPIPEDAVVIADYMLMADFVPATSVVSAISKGVRYQSGSRDIFYDSGAALNPTPDYVYLGYQQYSYYNNNATSEAKFTAFGHAYGCHYVRGTNREDDIPVRLDGSNFSYVGADVWSTDGAWAATNGTITKDTGSDRFDAYGIKNQVLGNHTFGDKKSSGSDYNTYSAFEVASPIHTSSHYQTFETPFLHELVGGDRNMEQTNLVVTPDGKTWDEVTRDTSYIGKGCVYTSETLADFTGGGTLKYDKWRGRLNEADYGNKDFAIAYDRIICLKAGNYKVSLFGHTQADGSSGTTQLYKNGTLTTHLEADPDSARQGQFSGTWNFNLIRGDQLRVDITNWRGHEAYNHFTIERI